MILYIILTVYLILNIFFFGTYLWSSHKDIDNVWQIFGLACLFAVMGTILFIVGYVGYNVEEYINEKNKL